MEYDGEGRYNPYDLDQLEPRWERKHRARIMSEKNEVIVMDHVVHTFTRCSIGYGIMIVACVQIIPPLRLRAHEVSSGKMPYDERYTPYIQELGLLPFI